LQPVYPVGKSDVYFGLTSLTVEQMQNVERDNLSTVLPLDPCQIYSASDIFDSVIYGGIHIFVPVFSDFEYLEISPNCRRLPLTELW
jgi:hypothetical protein